jgi:TolA-binding protein
MTMIISKKRFEKELMKAKDEGRSEIYRYYEDEERIRNLQSQIDRLGEQIDRVQRRVYDIETSITKTVITTCNNR